MKLTYNNREVEVDIETGVEIEDVFISSAYYVDNNLDLTDAEIEDLQDMNPDALYEAWFDRKISQGEDLYDRMKEEG